MPRNAASWTRMELLPIADRLALGDGFQDHWYRTIAEIIPADARVLDIGAGTGRGVGILRRAGHASTGIDPLPCGPTVVTMEDAIRFGVFSSPWEWLACIDVIEHVDDDVGLLRWMISTATQGVFISTPNWNYSKCANAYHCREYTPEELTEIVNRHRPAGSTVQWWTSGADCVARRIESTGEAEHNFGVEIRKGPEAGE